MSFNAFHQGQHGVDETCFDKQSRPPVPSFLFSDVGMHTNSVIASREAAWRSDDRTTRSPEIATGAAAPSQRHKKQGMLPNPLVIPAKQAVRECSLKQISSYASSQVSDSLSVSFRVSRCGDEC